MSIIRDIPLARGILSYSYLENCVRHLKDNYTDFSQAFFYRENSTIQLYQGNHCWIMGVTGLNELGIVAGSVSLHYLPQSQVVISVQDVPLVGLVKNFPEFSRSPGHGLLSLLWNTAYKSSLGNILLALRPTVKMFTKEDIPALFWGGSPALAKAWKGLIPCMTMLFAQRTLEALFEVIVDHNDMDPIRWGIFQEILENLAILEDSACQ